MLFTIGWTNGTAASFVSCGMCLSYTEDPLAEPIALPNFSDSFCLLPWGAFSNYGLFAFSVGNKGLRRCCYRLVKTHIDPENANSYRCFHCLTVGKVNLIEAWSRNFFFSTASSKERYYRVTFTAVKETFCFLTKKHLFLPNLITPTLYLFSENNRWERIKQKE